MAEYITHLDYLILMFIQEHLRVEWLTKTLVFISHLGNSGLSGFSCACFFLF